MVCAAKSARSGQSNDVCKENMSAIPPEDTQFFYWICDQHGWCTTYAWHAILLWLRCRHRIPASSGVVTRQDMMRVCIELAVLWLGPQDETGKLPLRLLNEANLWRVLFGNPLPRTTKVTRRCQLHMRVFLEILGGRMP